MNRAAARASILLTAVLAAACDRRTPPPPPSTTPGAGEQITGSERIGWDQRATNVAELSTFRYAIYVDGARSELTNASCASAPANGSFACSARLPSLRRGTHTLELAAFVVDGTVLESQRSSALQVTVAAALAPAPTPAQPSFRGGTFRAGDEVLEFDVVAEGVARPAAVAVAPDGRVFVADGDGRVRLEADGALLPQPAFEPDRDGQLVLAIAFDPQFARTRFVYLLFASGSPREGRTFTVARFREVGGIFGEQVVLLDGVAASEQAAGSLRVGPDGKLYVALDDGGDPSHAGDTGSFNGKLLRLNTDGTTPRDHAGGSPVFAQPFHAPPGLDFAGRAVWIADHDERGDRIVAATIVTDGSGTRASIGPAARLPDGASAAAVVSYDRGPIAALRGSVLIASPNSEAILQLRLDPSEPTRIVGIERLLAHRVGAVRALAIAPDGSLYFATATAVGRLGLR